jgi:pimeloyl-ACP methyl ester carboxylesterase
MRRNIFIVFFVVGFMLNGQLAAEGIKELSREQQIAEKLALTADADETISLKAPGGRFIGLYKRAKSSEIKTGEAHGVVILVHGMGAHPDWPDVISPLRTRLTEFGWSTLSIQMPILSPEEPIAEYGKTLKRANGRIQAAVDYLREWEIESIILLGYSFGAAQAANYLASNKPEDIKAFVSVSMLAQKFIRPGLDVYKFIGGITIPILDIYGEEDLEDVRRGIDDRRLAASKNGNDGFQQIELQMSGHHYLGFEDALVEQIQIWLQSMMLAMTETVEISEISPEILHERQ